MESKIIKMAEENIYSYTLIKNAYEWLQKRGGNMYAVDMWLFFPIYMLIDMRDRGIIS